MDKCVLFPLIVALTLSLVRASEVSDQVQTRDWSHLNDTKWIPFFNPLASRPSKLAYGFCDKQAKNGSKSCTFHLESYESTNSNSMNCTSEFHSSDLTRGPTFSMPMVLDLVDNENKIVMGYFDFKNYSAILVMRLIDMRSCKTHDIPIKCALLSEPTYRVMSYGDTFDVLYVHDYKMIGKRRKLNVDKLTFDKDGKQIGGRVPIFANIPDEELSPYMYMIFSPLSQLVPIGSHGAEKGFFFLTYKCDQVKIIAPNGEVKNSKRINFVYSGPVPYENGTIALTTEYEEKSIKITQIDKELNVIQEVAFNQSKTFTNAFVGGPQSLLILTSDNIRRKSQRNFYLEKIVAGSERHTKPIHIGKLFFEEEWPALFYLTYSQGRICVNALSSNDILIQGLKYRCIPEKDL